MTNRRHLFSKMERSWARSLFNIGLRYYIRQMFVIVTHCKRIKFAEDPGGDPKSCGHVQKFTMLQKMFASFPGLISEFGDRNQVPSSRIIDPRFI